MSVNVKEEEKKKNIRVGMIGTEKIERWASHTRTKKKSSNEKGTPEKNSN